MANTHKRGALATVAATAIILTGTGMGVAAWATDGGDVASGPAAPAAPAVTTNTGEGTETSPVAPTDGGAVGGTGVGSPEKPTGGDQVGSEGTTVVPADTPSTETAPNEGKPADSVNPGTGGTENPTQPGSTGSDDTKLPEGPGAQVTPGAAEGTKVGDGIKVTVEAVVVDKDGDGLLDKGEAVKVTYTIKNNDARGFSLLPSKELEDAVEASGGAYIASGETKVITFERVIDTEDGFATAANNENVKFLPTGDIAKLEGIFDDANERTAVHGGKDGVQADAGNLYNANNKDEAPKSDFDGKSEAEVGNTNGNKVGEPAGDSAQSIGDKAQSSGDKAQSAKSGTAQLGKGAQAGKGGLAKTGATAGGILALAASLLGSGVVLRSRKQG